MVLDTAADDGVRMSTESITAPALRSAVLEERRFEQPELHPRRYRELFHGREFDQAEYRKLVDSAHSAAPSSARSSP